ncbi:MAG: fructose-bisphosphatase class II [Brevundimonas sp.]
MANPAPYPSTLAADAARVTELAAIASYAGIGRGDEKAADQLAEGGDARALLEESGWINITVPYKVSRTRLRR